MAVRRPDAPADQDIIVGAADVLEAGEIVGMEVALQVGLARYGLTPGEARAMADALQRAADQVEGGYRDPVSYTADRPIPEYVLRGVRYGTES